MTLDRMMYLVIADHSTGPLIYETELGRTTREAVTSDLRTGQFGDVLAVLEINPAEGICREVTDEFRETFERDPHDA